MSKRELLAKIETLEKRVQELERANSPFRFYRPVYYPQDDRKYIPWNERGPQCGTTIATSGYIEVQQ